MAPGRVKTAVRHVQTAECMAGVFAATARKMVSALDGGAGPLLLLLWRLKTL